MHQNCYLNWTESTEFKPKVDSKLEDRLQIGLLILNEYKQINELIFLLKPSGNPIAFW